MQNKKLFKSTQKRGVVYTCFTSGYDDLIQHTYVSPHFDYVCFTDDTDLIKQEKVGIWEIRPMIFKELDNAHNIRWYKLLPHRALQNYRLSIWVDANINILTPKLFNLINSETEMLFPRHHARDCIYQECLQVLEAQKDSYENVMPVAEFLLDQDMPRNYGMNEANILIRRHHHPLVKKVMEEWWNMVVNYSRRDQLSLSYVLWKNGIRPEEVAFDNARNDKENFTFEEHKISLNNQQGNP